ncbi:ATP-binding protein [Mangrovibacterium marinum]|uniref:Serine/threonine-protein kinase RsbW n=1 Tax=Mangrovibacterium marinum TaxID=1639118 RepID=A0A2T5C2L2_9BACT|nr:ATP-binding protein [Mangrovibacterium marinum]PTN08922.1 serine/threonine-protein kinase RsbW [Mangrovibacterium marinum]
MRKSLRIPSDFRYLNEVQNFVSEIVSTSEFGDAKGNFVKLGVCESVSNAIGHGNKFDHRKFVTVFAEFTDDALLFEVQDEGAGFDYTNIPDPTAADNLHKEGGRGLFIIQRVVDEVKFKNNGSIIQLKFKFKSAHTVLS